MPLGTTSIFSKDTMGKASHMFQQRMKAIGTVHERTAAIKTPRLGPIEEKAGFGEGLSRRYCYLLTRTRVSCNALLTNGQASEKRLWKGAG